MRSRKSALLDLVFTIDCTASMGPYIDTARDNVIDIVNELTSTEDCDLRLALVEYRDHPPADLTFVTKVHDFTEYGGTMKRWLRDSDAGGGGDLPEAVADALKATLDLSWRQEATKVCVFITDAPPHGLGTYGDKFPAGCPDGLDPMGISRDLAAKGVAVYIAGCEPSICAYKDFYLAVAHVTGGQYVPLEKAGALVNIIVYGSKEEMSLKKFENEVEKEIEERIASGKAIDEADLSVFLHTKWTERGETTKQLHRNNRTLKTALASKTAKHMTKMSFCDVQTHYKSVKPCRFKDKKAEDESDSDSSPDSTTAGGDMAEKLKLTTDALAQLATLTTKKSGTSVTVNLGGLAKVFDESPKEATPGASDHPPPPSIGGFQCVNDDVTLSQASRLVQKSVIKINKTLRPGTMATLDE